MATPAFPALEHTPSAVTIKRVAALLGAGVQSWHPVRGGNTVAERWRVEDTRGRSAFVKLGTTEQTVAWLRDEWRIYGQLAAPFLPAVLGWDEGDAERGPLLLLEDLSAAHWPPPWTPKLIQRTLDALTQVASTTPPSGLPLLVDEQAELPGWSRVATAPDAFLGLALCSPQWLERALSALLAAEQAAVLEGDNLLHLDVRSDNLCLASDHVVLVDWNWACRGNGRADVAWWLPSLASEGGPLPDEILPNEPAFAALLSGYWAARAGLPPPLPGSPLRATQLRQLRSALPWAARALGLPPLDGPAL